MEEKIRNARVVQDIVATMKKGVTNVELFKGHVKKYDSKRNSLSKRYMILTDLNLTYYHAEKEYVYNPEDFIARIYLCDISIIKKYVQSKAGNRRSFNLDIYTTKCTRRSKVKGARVFRFGMFTEGNQKIQKSQKFNSGGCSLQ